MNLSTEIRKVASTLKESSLLKYEKTVFKSNDRFKIELTHNVNMVQVLIDTLDAKVEKIKGDVVNLQGNLVKSLNVHNASTSKYKLLSSIGPLIRADNNQLVIKAEFTIHGPFTDTDWKLIDGILLGWFA